MFHAARIKLIQALVEEHGLDKFFTLTLARGGGDPGGGDPPWDYIHVVWSRFRKRMRRRDADFKFVSVLESHKDTRYPHIHGFTNIWMPQKEWSEKWESCGGGPVVWVERVRDGNVADYAGKELAVAKYVGKEQIAGAVARTKGKRTLWRSKRLKAKFELTKSEDWVIIKEDVYDSSGRLNLEGQKKNGTQKECLAATCRTVSCSSN